MAKRLTYLLSLSLSLLIVALPVMAGPMSEDVEVPPTVERDISAILSAVETESEDIASIINDSSVSIETRSNDIFDRDASLQQWSYENLLSTSEKEPNHFFIIFKVLGLFMVLMMAFVIHRLIKLRKLRAMGPRG